MNVKLVKPAAVASVGAELCGLGDTAESIQREVAAEYYSEIEVEFDPRHRAYWFFMRPREAPSYTLPLLRDVKQMQHSVKRLYARHLREGQQPIRYLVGASRLPGIFNLGGDLRYFADRIRAEDRAGLQHYAYACIDVLHNSANSLDLPIVTVALVQGEAYGGGFESALSCDLIVAEKSVKFGLPEILINLLPGMGAYSFLSRRLDIVRAEKMIMSGRIYSAGELHEMGLVDVLAEDGHGEDTVRDMLARHGRRYNAYRTLYQMRRRVRPISYEELKNITDLWVDAALGVSEPDLRKMERLAMAQNRRRSNDELALSAK
jgi:DSF synthase